jgi:hypothetical protein
MAGLGSNKKRNNPSAQTKRVSRFTEALGAAQSNAQIPEYPDGQVVENANTQQSDEVVGYPDIQPSAQQDTQIPELNHNSTHVAGYSDIQPSAQPNIKQSDNDKVAGYPDAQQPTQQDTSKAKSTKIDGQSKTRNQKQLQNQQSNEVAGYSDSQQPVQQDTQKPNNDKTAEYSNIRIPTQQVESQSKRLAKRENPDYTQTTFRIPKKLSRQIDRAIMDLADENVEIDRSDLLEELAGAFIRLADDVGVFEAIQQFKNLGTR